MPADPAPAIGFEIKVVRGNVLKFKADVLAIKYSQSWSTLSQNIIKNLPDDSVLIERPPQPGAWLLVDAEDAVAADKLLLIGTQSRKSYSYESMHELARTALHALAETDSEPPITHLAITMNGLGWGFDEAESIKAMVLGFNAAVADDKYPHQLERISIVESQTKRADVLQAALTELLGNPEQLTNPELPRRVADPPAKKPERKAAPLIINTETPPPAIETPSLDEPSVFVAMPFAPKYKDAFYYAIQPCVKELGYQCIRLDESSYVGDIVETIKDRIESARLVIALLDGNNPNVYLEIGYAWGVGTPTMFIINQEQDGDVPFDVRGQRRLTYDSLYEFKPILLEELKAVLDQKVLPRPKTRKRATAPA